MFKTIEEAIADFSKKAIPKTDITNREHAAILREKNDKYYYTKIEKGFRATVWPTAIKGMLYRGKKYFLHTHPNSGRKNSKGEYIDNTPFSGVPGSKKAKDAGDAMVVDMLGYDGIYLISAMGNAYLYEGVGKADENDNTHADNKNDLRKLKPVIEGLSKSQYSYKRVLSKNKKRVKYEPHSWTP